MRRSTRFALLTLIIGLALSVAAIARPASDSTADHSKFPELQKPFASGPEVTQACLGCHTEAASQLHQTTHWTWAFDNDLTGQQLGKKNVFNNFCVATATNWPRCTSCHIGYGWKDDNFDLTAEQNVDCLVCHDTTGGYRKFPTGAGHPNYTAKEWPPKSGNLRPAPDLTAIAQQVGKPSRSTCHFYGGGGDGVKHGHLDSSMHAPDRDLDVHMDAEGLNFSCQTCHVAGGHQISGSRYATLAQDPAGIVTPGGEQQRRASCESCHGSAPHGAEAHHKLDGHADKVACVTCHIPEYARGGRKTKLWWDWSQAGQPRGEHGDVLVERDAEGYETFNVKKGEFVWGANVEPEYYWYDGHIRFNLLGDPIDPSGEVAINELEGSYANPDARIWPFKVMRGRQPYDKVHKVLAIPHLFGKDDTAFWKNFDWPRALKTGLQARDIDFSGEYGFVDTRYYWPVTHMVAPKEDALSCESCHQADGRLAALDDFYMPGRGQFAWLDRLGIALVVLTLLGVIGHGVGRILSRRQRRS